MIKEQNVKPQELESKLSKQSQIKKTDKLKTKLDKIKKEDKVKT